MSRLVGKFLELRFIVRPKMSFVAVCSSRREEAAKIARRPKIKQKPLIRAQTDQQLV